MLAMAEGFGNDNLLWDDQSWAFPKLGGHHEQDCGEKLMDIISNSDGQAAKNEEAPPQATKGKKRSAASKGGGGGESDDHELHIWTERERRKKMRNMFSNLHALLPHLPPKANGASDQFLQAFPVEEIYKQVAAEIMLTTVVRLVTDDSLPRELGAPRFTRFADLPPLRGSNTLIVFSEGQLILAASDKMPIIAAIRLAVSHDNGISILARGSANIVLNPSYSDSQSLRNWRSKNHAYLIKIVKGKKYIQHSTCHLMAPQEKYSSVANVLTNETEPKFRVRVTAKISDLEQKLWYMACSNCYKSTVAEYLSLRWPGTRRYL
ncbi:hypothetical protein BUALT_Bualt15G0041700 [Buddleja alternifolia]|uniref:BHLH domain-containing protein n=1 Tax=Buddleja alternifolia TaxID=168488 RepID=A0AAV6WK75_9LAMI|nr:hypothetical protein BUALT_Bualt15G0041700 [Buddleja alternifolia]